MRRYFNLLSRDQWVVFASWFLWGLGTGLWFNFQTLYIEELGANPQQVGAVVGLSGLVIMFLYVPAGLLADRWRRKPMIIGGWILGTLATLLVAVAPDWRWVAPALAVYWLSSFSRPAVAGHIAVTDRSGNLTRSFAILSTGAFVGEIISPPFGGLIGEIWGLRAIFWVAGGIYTLSTLVMLLLSDLPPAPRERRANPGAVIFTRPFLWQILVFALVIFALELGYVLAPNYLQHVKGLSLQQIGQLGTAMAIGRLILMFIFGHMQPARKLPVLLNQAAALLGLLLLLSAPLAIGAGVPPLVYFLIFFLRGSDRAVFPIIRGRVSLWLQPAVFSLGFSLVDTATRVAQTLAPVVAGQLYAANPALPAMAGIGALGAGLLLSLTLPRFQQQPAAEAPTPAPDPV